MKNYTKISSIIFIVVVSISLSVITKLNATVGGETLIDTFVYNPTNESVYYRLSDGGGRGCPPILKSLSLTTEKTLVVFSCDEGEKLSQEQVNSKINNLINGFKYLTPLNLKSNAITIDVQFVKDETYGTDSSEVMLKHFTALLYQHGKKIMEFPLSGCYIDQPFMFQGYSIPGFNKKIILLVSAIGNCSEGGYISEGLQIVGGVDNLDKTVSGNFYKVSSPLSPNRGNLVIFESDTPSTSTINKSVTITPVIETPVIETPVKESPWVRFINWIKGLF